MKSSLLKCLSHTPLRGLNDPGVDVTQAVDAVIAQARRDVEAFDPELIVLFAPDHYNGLFYDLMPQFVVAAGAESVGDYGTPTGALSVDRQAAGQLARHLLDDAFDVTVSHRLQVDHGCTQTLVELTGSLTRYPVLPIVINSVAPPFCSYRRIRQLGESVGRFIAGLDRRTFIVGSGGLSHEPPVPLLHGAQDDIAEFLIAGRNPTPEARAARQARTIAAGRVYGTPGSSLTPLNPEWDQAFIELLLQGRLRDVDDFDLEEISKAAGRSTHEIRNWVAAFAALSSLGAYRGRLDFYRPIPEWIAGYGVVSAEPVSTAAAINTETHTS